MNQGITISLNTINYLSQNLPTVKTNNAQKIIELFDENFLITDSKLEYAKILWERVENILNKELKEYLLDFIKKSTKNNLNPKINLLFTIEEVMALKSIDKIFLDPTLEKKEIKKLQMKYPIEVHNAQSFVTPEIHHRLKHSKCTLVFESSEIYDFKHIFEPYIRNAKKIIIEDPYLPNHKAFHNLKLLLSVFEGSEIVIKTYSKHYYLKNKKGQEDNFTKLELFIKNLMRNKIKVKHLFYDQGKHKERYIYTDIVKIKVPGGLDFLDNDGKINSSVGFLEVEVSKL